MDKLGYMGDPYHDGTITRDQYDLVRAETQQDTQTAAPQPQESTEHTESAAQGDDWMKRAACKFEGATSNIFFPPYGFERKHDKIEREEQAKAICATCPVIEPCLESALQLSANQQFGVQGGLTEDERKLILRNRR